MKKSRTLLFAARIGMAFTFCWPGISTINNSERSNFGELLLNSMGFDPTTAIQMISSMIHLKRFLEF